VFRVTAEALRAAQGDVRCGVCSTTFNALENLSEQAFRPASDADVPSPDDSMTVEELPGTENIELSAPVELAVVPDAPPPEDDAQSMEFHGDAADLERLFVVEEPALAKFDPAEAASTLDSTDEHPILVLDERDEPAEEESRPAESIVLETPSPAPASHTSPRILIPDEMRRRLAEEAAARAEAESLFASHEESPSILERRWPWMLAVAVLAAAFLLQVLHAERNDLARSPTLGPLVAGAYAFFGASVLAPTDLSAYELRQWGAASDPAAPGRLMLRASIVNRAPYAQPLPLLRLALQDRFGGTLGMRDIGPADYLPGAGGSSLLEPGERADALIRIVDPGTEAVGFELDVCLPANGGVRCAGQLKTAGP